VRPELPSDRQVGVLVAVAGVGDEHVLPAPDVVVAAGSVVRGIVDDHAVVGGSPARVLRRFEPGVGWVTAGGDVRPVATALT
jgi:hypothetical protein